MKHKYNSSRLWLELEKEKERRAIDMARVSALVFALGILCFVVAYCGGWVK